MTSHGSYYYTNGFNVSRDIDLCNNNKNETWKIMVHSHVGDFVWNHFHLNHVIKADGFSVGIRKCPLNNFSPNRIKFSKKYKLSKRRLTMRLKMRLATQNFVPLICDMSKHCAMPLASSYSPLFENTEIDT